MQPVVSRWCYSNYSKQKLNGRDQWIRKADVTVTLSKSCSLSGSKTICYNIYIAWKAGCQQCRKVRGTHAQVPLTAVPPMGTWRSAEVSQGYNQAILYSTCVTHSHKCDWHFCATCHVHRIVGWPVELWNLEEERTIAMLHELRSFLARSGTDRPARCSR